MFIVYVIQNERSNRIYIGQTADLETRLNRHNRKLSNKSTSFTSKNRGTWKVVYKENYDTREKAFKREKELKSFRGREFVKSKIR
jgi:putative endonuclease